MTSFANLGTIRRQALARALAPGMLLCLVAACGSGSKASPAATPASPVSGTATEDDDMGMMKSMSVADQAMVYGPLVAGADWKTYTKLNTVAVMSKTHGGRFVDTWVNAAGVQAYKSDDAEIPVGTVIVKSSWDAKDGAPSSVAGPIFVMEKREAGYDEEHNDWYYAIHWAEPPAKWKERLGGPIYWQSPSMKVQYCWDCHESYDRELGGIPAGSRSW